MMHSISLLNAFCDLLTLQLGTQVADVPMPVELAFLTRSRGN